MRVRLGTVDGVTHESDEFTAEEIQKGLDEANGYVGTGDYANHKFTEVDEVLEFMLEFCKYDKSNNTQKFSIEVDGNTRTFNVQHIVWYEVRKNAYERQVSGSEPS